MYKILSILLTLMMTPFVIMAESLTGSCGENATWTFDGGTLRISGTGATIDYTSPDYLYKISPEWFDFKEEIYNLVVDEGITSIGDYSFYDCTNLKSVSFPDGLISIGNNAFSKCISLEEVEFPSTLEYLGGTSSYNTNKGGVFYECLSLEKITLPEGLKLITMGTFNECVRLRTVYWNAIDCDAEVLDAVARYMGIFIGSPVETVKFGPNVESIPEQAFYNVGTLNNVSTNGKISFIGYDAFAGTSWQMMKLEETAPMEIVYVDNVAYMFDKSFETEYQGIKNYSIVIRDGTKCITDRLFENSLYLEKVTIPQSVEQIGNYTFKDCSSLKVIEWNPVSINTEDGQYAAKGMFSNTLNVSLDEFIIGENVMSLPANLLENCDMIKELYLPESLRYIGDSAFRGCSSLESLTLPDGVERLGRTAIYDCRDLKQVTVGEGLKEFDYYFFLGNCPNLTLLEWNAVKTVEKDFDVYHDTDACYAPVETFILGDKVEYVPGQLFWNSESLREIKFGESVKEIGEAAFRSCHALESVSLPQSLEVIGAHAFYDSSLESVIIPENVTRIGVWAFLDINSLKMIIFTTLNVPDNGSAFIKHEGLHVYVSDYESYMSDNYWASYGPMLEPILTASTNQLNFENPVPIFGLNIPDYTIAYMDNFEPDTEHRENVAYLSMFCEGPQGDFSVTVPYRYTFDIISSVGQVEDNDNIEIFDLSGAKVYEGTQTNIKTVLSPGIYILKNQNGSYKINI